MRMQNVRAVPLEKSSQLSRLNQRGRMSERPDWKGMNRNPRGGVSGRDRSICPLEASHAHLKTRPVQRLRRPDGVQFRPAEVQVVDAKHHPDTTIRACSDLPRPFVGRGRYSMAAGRNQLHVWFQRTDSGLDHFKAKERPRTTIINVLHRRGFFTRGTV